MRVVASLACVLTLAAHSSEGKRSRRRKYNPTQFHKRHVWQQAETYMPPDWNGRASAQEMKINEMFGRIVDGWPGARYASDPENVPVIEIADFVTAE